MTLTTLQLSHPKGTVCYREVGEGEPLVLVHGVGMQDASWEPQIEHFAKTHRVIAVNMPGHGGSTALPQGSQLEDYVAWLHAAISALGFEQVNLAGHSMGALISGGYAATYPERVKRVALLNGVYRRSPEARSAVEARAKEIAEGNINIDGPLSRWFSESTADQQAKEKVGNWLREVDPVGYAVTYNAFAHGDATYADKWEEIRCPALLLTGDGDPNSTKEMAVDMAKAAQDGMVCIIEGHRHMVNLTAPEQVNAAMASWLKQPIRTNG